MKEQASKNKSILHWAREEANIPGGSREDEHLEDEEKEISPDGWRGDLPEEVRHARTTGGTSQHHKSQEVKDGPEGRIETAEPNMMTDYGVSRNLRVDENDPFDKQANDDIDCMMRMMIDPKKYDPEDSLKMEENNVPEYNEEINFEEKVCLELKEMRVLDINPDELRAWMSPGYEDEDDVVNDVVKNEPGVEYEMYENGTWMLSGWVGINNSSSSRTVGRGKNNVHELCTNKLGCACTVGNYDVRPPKEILDLLRGSYSCTSGPSMKRKRTLPRGTFRTSTPPWSGRARRSTMIRGRRRGQNDNMVSLEMSWKSKLEHELSVHQSQPKDGRAQDHRDGEVGGGGDHGQVRRGDGADQVCDGEPVKISFTSTLTKVKPKDWKIVKKRGIIPDGLVQAKLKSFIIKFPNLERGCKRNNDGSTPNLGEGGSGVPNGVPNVE